MQTEIRHFTDELLKDDPYGYQWERVVDEYLKNGYKKDCSQYELTVFGVTYKVLKRGEVTAFYDADGNTLFDVTNERLEKEYEWLGKNNVNIDLEDSENAAEEEKSDTVKEKTDTEAGEVSEVERTEDEEENYSDDETQADDNIIPMGKASLKDLIMGCPKPTAEEIEAAKVKNAKSINQRAKEKLEKELKATKDKAFAEPIIGYLLERCAEDEGLAQDVVQEHKAWQKCFDYIYSQARKQSKGSCTAVRDDVVYEWVEDYYHKDDKAEEKKKAKEKAERKARQKKETERRKAKAEEYLAKTTPTTQKKGEVLKELPKQKKSGKDMEGQLDLFSMMGM